MSFIYKDGTYYSKSESGGGSGLPDGGTTGQILAKHSNTDQDVEWKDEVSYSGGDGINIDANNEISTDNMPAADMSEVVTPLPSVMSRMPILFDETGEERMVGWYKFSNGTKKPVYEKTFTFTSPSNATSSKVVENITNLDKCISFEGYIIATGCLPLNWYFNSNRYLNAWWDSTVNALYMTCSNSAEQSKDGIVVIRYTKTTDTPA